MNKKVPLWFLLSTVIVMLFFSFGVGVLVRQGLEGITKTSNFSIRGLTNPLIELTRWPERVLISLVSDQMQVKTKSSQNDGGFIGNNVENSFLLLSRFDPIIKDHVVEIVDLSSFEIILTLNPNHDQMNSNFDSNENLVNLKRDYNDKRAQLLHPLITKNLDMVYNSGLFRAIDNKSNTSYQLDDFRKFHHAIEEDHDGNIWTSVEFYPYRVNENWVGTKPDNFKDDGIVKISPDGEVLFSRSISKLLIDNNRSSDVFVFGSSTAPTFQRDPIHINDIQPVLSDGKFWKKGDVFLSLAGMSSIMLYRPSTDKIIWELDSHISRQHDVDIVNDDTISIFNNNSYNFYNGYRVEGNNEILLYNFEDDLVSSYLEDSMTKYDVRTVTQGLHEILPNGDLFIEETNFGRLLYFKSDGSLEWEYNNKINGANYLISWSRIIYKKKDIERINNFIREVKDL
jgi:hypothetical protein